MKRPKRQDYCNVHGYLIFEEKLIKAQELYIDHLEKQMQESDCISDVVVPKVTVCECGGNKQEEETYCSHCLEKVFWGDM